jgi:hypothetical protein
MAEEWNGSIAALILAFAPKRLLASFTPEKTAPIIIKL